ncbi:MAG TPA: DNA-binding response regulator [Ruminococcus sp.]|nr:DNA-binding response regulator [Ruminococcus sp.]
MNQILVVEDEKNISTLICMALSQVGYKCETASDGEIAADMLEKKRYDLILLDVMLPKIDGFELIEYIKDYDIPVIFITAKSDVKDRVKGLNLGADDYITKPFDVSELQARVEAVLRRYSKSVTHFSFDDIEVDTESMIVTKSGEPVDLTIKEFEILLLFLRNKNIALYREMIYEKVWKEPYMGDTRTVDLHIQRLRKKLGIKDKIQSVFKVGYRFVDK